MMTIVEKILARASGRARVSPGNYVTAKIDGSMMPEAFRLIKDILSRAGIRLGQFRIWDPERFFVITDHRVPPFHIPSAENQKISREFARKLNVKYFYDVFAGVCHQ